MKNKIKVSCHPVCGTMAGSTYDLPKGEYTLVNKTEVYHGIYQDVNEKVAEKFLRPYSTIEWPVGTKVSVRAGGVFLIHEKIGTFYAIKNESNLQTIPDNLE